MSRSVFDWTPPLGPSLREELDRSEDALEAAYQESPFRTVKISGPVGTSGGWQTTELPPTLHGFGRRLHDPYSPPYGPPAWRTDTSLFDRSPGNVFERPIARTRLPLGPPP